LCFSLKIIILKLENLNLLIFIYIFFSSRKVLSADDAPSKGTSMEAFREINYANFKVNFS